MSIRFISQRSAHNMIDYLQLMYILLIQYEVYQIGNYNSIVLTKIKIYTIVRLQF